MTGNLQGRRCLITGASRGLGSKIAATFWEAGADLLLIARSEAALRQVAEGFPQRPSQSLHLFPADLTVPTSAKNIVTRARTLFDRLDIVVNNAAIQGPIGPLWTNDVEGWRTAIQVNLLSPVELCRQCVPWMKESRGGKIINLSGGGATGPRANFTAYATAKAGLVRFSETLAEETRSLGIDVNCVAPGAMPTALLKEVVETGAIAAGAHEFDIASKTFERQDDPSGRAAALCCFLASLASNGITGKLISAVWDPWESLAEHCEELQRSDIYTLRRIVPADRGATWGNDR